RSPVERPAEAYKALVLTMYGESVEDAGKRLFVCLGVEAVFTQGRDLHTQSRDAHLGIKDSLVDVDRAHSSLRYWRGRAGANRWLSLPVMPGELVTDSSTMR